MNGAFGSLYTQGLQTGEDANPDRIKVVVTLKHVFRLNFLRSMGGCACTHCVD